MTRGEEYTDRLRFEGRDKRAVAELIEPALAPSGPHLYAYDRHGLAAGARRNLT
jgi:hypothetical protein